jgi:hypothetical protein
VHRDWGVCLPADWRHSHPLAALVELLEREAGTVAGVDAKAK